MTKADEARQKYVAEYQTFKDASVGLAARLAEFARERGFAATVEAREKTVASFVKKAHRRQPDDATQPKYIDPWAQITDKVGARVVVESLPALGALRQAIERDTLDGEPFFDVQDKTASSSPTALFYPGIHAQVMVPGFTTSDGQPIEAEVQLRTKAQDLWATTSHKLIYKGVVEPGRTAHRRIMRLSVLVEMFDEEVERAMNELAADPAYRTAGFLHVTEAEYLRFVADPGEPGLSLEVLEALSSLVDTDPTQYAETLRSFVAAHENKLRDAFDTYGAYSEFAEQYVYWLFSQPEAVMVFHLIETKPLELSRVVQQTELSEAVSRLYAAWGKQMPTVGY